MGHARHQDLVTLFNDLGGLQEEAGKTGTRNVGGVRPCVPPGTDPTNPALLPPDLRFLAQTHSAFFQCTTGDPERPAVKAFLMAFPATWRRSQDRRSPFAWAAAARSRRASRCWSSTPR